VRRAINPAPIPTNTKAQLDHTGGQYADSCLELSFSIGAAGLFVIVTDLELNVLGFSENLLGLLSLFPAVGNGTLLLVSSLVSPMPRGTKKKRINNNAVSQSSR
jgi:hypothetical protein